MESEDYEHIRNLTLMFFLEKILDRGGPRSLHDLSCQFGTKGFSKEMRQIAGGSQAGLKKFLLQYPSLFAIDGDLVSIAENLKSSNSSTSQVRTRDYTQEAIEYFKVKLRHYGPCTEVPIKSLLGHRSQAPPAVRHVSGQHVKEFRDFLARYPEEFVVKEDFVFLKEFEGNITSTFCEKDESCSSGTFDTRSTNAFVSYFKDILSREESVHLVDLFDSAKSQCCMEDEDEWNAFFKTSADLSTFLKIYSHIFTVKSNVVSLAPSKSALATESPSAAAAAAQRHWPGDKYCEDAASPPSFAAAPSSLSPPSSLSSSRNSGGGGGGSLKQRLNSVVMKMIADNTDKESRGGPSVKRDWPITNGGVAASNGTVYAAAPATPTVVDKERAKQVILSSVKVIVSTKESHQLMDDLLSRGSPVGVDVEGINLGPKGQITLVQLSTADKKAFLVDVQTCPAIVTQGGLQKLLESEHVVKVMHDCRNDSAALKFQYNVQLRNVFDTQCGHAILQFQEYGKPVYKVKNVSLGALCEAYAAQPNPLKDAIRSVYRRDQKFWARRPLTRDMVAYAAADVLALVPDIYHGMIQSIKKEHKDLFAELCEEQILLYIAPEEVRSRKKQRKIDNEVAELKMKLATAQGRQLVLSNREIRLLRFIELSEDDEAKLSGSYKVSKKLQKLKTRDASMLDSDDSDCDVPFCDELGGGGPNSLDSMPGSGQSSEMHSGDFHSLASAASSSAFMGAGGALDTPPPTHNSLPIISDVDMFAAANGEEVVDDRIQRIEKLESMLALAAEGALLDDEDDDDDSEKVRLELREFAADALLPAPPCACAAADKATDTRDAATQTLATGDIVITKVYSEPIENNN